MLKFLVLVKWCFWSLLSGGLYCCCSGCIQSR